MKFFSTFTGIGGFDLGLERAGWQCVGQCEIEPFCNAVLEKHWPNVWRHDNVKTLTGELIREHCGRVDAIVGGPPCQPSSVAGQRRGAADDRWLWPDFLRLVSEIQPLWVLAENPRGVLSLKVEGIQFSEWIADQFANRGYQLLPVELAAEDVGAPHRRERIFFVAYSDGGGSRGEGGDAIHKGRRSGDDGAESVQKTAGREDGFANRHVKSTSGDGLAITTSDGWRQGWTESEGKQRGFDAAVCGSNVADTSSTLGARLRSRETAYSAVSRKQSGDDLADALGVGQRESHNKASAESRQGTWEGVGGRSHGVGVGQADSNSARSQEHSRQRCDDGEEFAPLIRDRWPARPGEDQHGWEAPRVVSVESALGSSANGFPRELARWRQSALKACGNAIVPQCAEVLGRMINRFKDV